MKLFVALLLVLLLFSGCIKNKEDLTKMSEEKDSEGLIEFISDNMHFQSQEKKNLVEFAIDEIVSKDLKPGKKYIESIIRNGVPSEFVEKALNSYKNNQKPFLMVDEMLSNYFTIANGTTVPSYLDLYKSVIAIGDRNTIIEKIRKHFVSAVESNDLNKMASASDLLINKLKINDAVSIRIHQVIQSIIEFTDGEYYSLASYGKDSFLSEKIKSIKASYKAKRDQESKNWYSDHPSPEHFHENRPPDEVFNLQGYIVAKKGQNRYEVQIPGETYRALLYTSGTTYTTKGSFTLLVTKKGTEIVTIKEDYGGFTQEWNEYEEASDSEIKRWNAYLNRENGQADHTKLYNETLRPILENLEREEQTEIENTMRRYQSLSNEIRENYKKCFVL